MKKAIACLLALPLALAACGVQNVPAQAAQPTDTPVETTAPTTASTAPVEEPAASSEPARLALRASCAAQRTRFIPTPACTA